MVSLTLFYWDIITTKLNTLQKETVKSKLLDTTFSLFITLKKNKPNKNLSETELHTLNSLLQSKNIIIQNAEEGNTTVVIDKNAYKKKMKAIIWTIQNLKNMTIKKKSI